MSSVDSHATSTPSRSKAMHISLWVGQVLLALWFGPAGIMKLINAGMLPFPLPLTLFIGTAEVLGVIGVLVPALTRIKPMLTPLAAAGLATIMILATGFHLSRGEPFIGTAIFAVIGIFVAWGRFKKAPIAPRS